MSLTLAEVEWMRERYPLSWLLIREDMEREVLCAPLESSHIVTLHSGTKVEVRQGKFAVGHS